MVLYSRCFRFILVKLGDLLVLYKKLTHVQSRIVIGTRQTLKALKNSEVNEVFIANDADHQLIQPVITQAAELGIPCHHVDSMKKLGTASGIEVGTSVVSVKKE